MGTTRRGSKAGAGAASAFDALEVPPPTKEQMEQGRRERLAAKGHDCFDNVVFRGGERFDCAVCGVTVQE